MKPLLKPTNIKLTDDDRAKLEAIRAAGGYRSAADAVRAMIAARFQAITERKSDVR